MISVVMPAFNGARFVAESVRSVLDQRGVELELIVTDDGSTDTTPAIVAEIAARDDRVALTVAPRAGMSAARNACLRRARGDVVALLDQDDLWPPGKLARQLALLDASPRTSAVFGLTQVFAGAAESPPGYTMLLSAGLMRRTLVDRIGPFDSACGTADDLDFVLRMLEAGEPIELDSEVGVLHRRHPEQATADLAATRRDCVRTIAMSVRRRRARGVVGPLRHPLLPSDPLPRNRAPRPEFP